MKNQLTSFLAVALLFFCHSNGLTATRFSTALGGNWNESSTWTGGNIPNSGDTAVIIAGAAITVIADASISSITFSNGSSTTILTVEEGVTLSASQAITCQNSAGGNTSVRFEGAGTITCSSLAVGGTTTPTPVSSAFTATLTTTVSNLVIAGGLSVRALYNSQQSAANQGVFALNSGSVSASGVVFVTVPFFGPTLTLATGNQNGTLTLSGTPFTISGGGSSTFTPDGTNATVVYSGGSQTVRPATYRHLVLGGSGTKTTTGVSVNGVLSRQGTARLTAAPSYGPNAILEYKGSAVQTNGLELGAAILNLRIDNNDGLLLTNSPTVNGSLTLRNGRITTGIRQLTLGTNGVIAEGGTNSYVNGNLAKAFAPGLQSFLFPIGDGESFAPLALTNLTVTSAGLITASTRSGFHSQMDVSGIDTNRSVERYWTLTQSNGTWSGGWIDFYYPGSEVSAGADPLNFTVARWTGSAWVEMAADGGPESTSVSGPVEFGDFVIGQPGALTVVWTGGAGADMNWSAGANWMNNSVPRTIDIVSFFDPDSTGFVSNINNIVGTSITVGSLRFANTNGFHTTLIQAGESLTVISNMMVGTETYASPTQSITTTITGLTGTLDLRLPENVSWTVRQGVASGTLTEGTPSASLDLSGLGTFKVRSRGLSVGVESAPIRRVAGYLFLARTNLLVLSGLPAGGTTFSGNPGLYIGHNTQNQNVHSNGSFIYLGISNAVFADYIVIGRGNQTNNLLRFNPAMLDSNPTAYFRSVDGTNRVGLWTIGDNSASGNIGGPSSGSNDFTGGTVDARIGTMVVGRGAMNHQQNATGPGFGTLTFDRGLMDIDNMFIGFQNLGTNYHSPGIGTVNILSTNAVLVVNSTLELAHATNTSVTSPSGTLNVKEGHAAINAIKAGPGISRIAIDGGTMFVTNSAGNPGAPLTSLSLTNATIGLSISGSTTNIHTSSLQIGGAGNRIDIISLPEITSYPTQFTLIKYLEPIVGTDFNFNLGNLPFATPAYRGFISNDVEHSAVVLVLTPPPTELVIVSGGEQTPTAGEPFEVTIQAQTSDGTPCNVADDTFIVVGLQSGGGILGGVLTGHLGAGSNTVTLDGVTYTKAEADVQLNVAVVSGENLAPGVGNPFLVVPGALTQLQLLLPGETPSPGIPPGKTGTPLPQTVGVPFNTIVRSVDEFANLVSTNHSIVLESTDAEFVMPGPTNLTGGLATLSTTFRTAGVQTVVANDSTDPGVVSASSQTTVDPGSQSISFPPLVSQVYGAAPVTLNANASSGLQVLFETISGPGQIQSNHLAITGAGEIVVRATQSGNDNWNPAPPQIQSVSVSQALLTVIAEDKSRPYGTTNPVFTVRYEGFVNGDDPTVLSGVPLLETPALKDSPVGTYDISAGTGTLSSPNYSFTFGGGTLTVFAVPPVLKIATIPGAGGMSLVAAGLTPFQNYEIVASTNLSQWLTIGVVVADANGVISFGDTNASQFSTRFYRLAND